MTTIIGTGEVGALHSREELEEMQRLPLQRKIQITTARIIEWYQHYDGKVYVAFSGGKDSTVLLDIVRRIYPDVPAVFSDTGLEFPEVREFVKSCENVTIVRPEMNFRKVIEVYGYPVVSKRVANTVEYGHKPGSFRWKELHGEIMRSNGTPSEFNCEKWCYLLDAPFKVSSRCCTIMKKQPMKKYSKETGRVPIIATMANESRSRRATWLRMGCNAFSGKKPSSQPMSFWTEEDVLEYLYLSLNMNVSDQTRINLPPRIRMATLYAISQSLPHGGRVANTCNRSEDYVGYSTKFGDSAGDFSPLANLMVHEVIQIGYELLLPINLISKIPSDGLCGKTDEDNLGFTYAHLDAYIMYGTSGIEEIDKKIASMHDHNLHKLNPMPTYGTTIF